MAAIDRIRDRFEQIGTSITEGWRRLTDAAGQAVTRFTPSHRESAEGSHDLDRRNIGWGLLPVEVFDQGGRIEVRLEAPGLEREDIEVEVVDDHAGTSA
ncbi:Hsp20/alpha crystallin family protein [Guyparkeria hydrothermalis]|uniref:Hsp20/alpha crystallin family protein n=1 Tax=Guyparkeria hydrothermalis TaxID=923 RepID=UPI00202249A6|nr:Hsp20/alpha crystallin family protein [Guyparkeria hydrothermalis]MCL7750156.1 Hsp20/alpha crystallin family protein [Guyparkeria hydrothermalis]